MDFQYTPEQEAYRAEVRGWLQTNLPPDLCVDDARDERIAPDRKTFERRRIWQHTMHEAGWVGIAWPQQYGGRGAGLMEQVIFDEEYTRARAPVLPGYSGVALCGPTLMQWGTDEQKKRFLSRILSAEDIWCQGYSEPDAGSDLAGLQTRAVDMGDFFVVNGQKVWTSGAQYADWIFMLVRTDPNAPKHNGISYLLVDMKTPGITVRPLVLANGHAHFNEVFFERSIAGGGNYEEQILRLATVAKQLRINGQPAWEQSWVRQKLTQLLIECECLKYTRLRTFTRQLKGLPPGPEGSMLKLTGSELGVRIAHLASELLGANAVVNEPMDSVPDAPRWFNRVLSARQYTIAGGTSEIQHNIIGERVLGLPKG
jgi:alkylation response protein AidB-like acyl-CoA dehydrogenase